MSFSVQKDDGFTLIEVLVSLFIFALLSAGTLSVMSQTIAAKTKLEATTDALADVVAMRAVLRSDMEAMVLRPMRDGLGGTLPYLVTMDDPTIEDDLLTFTRLGRANPTGAARGQAQRVRYRFTDGQLIRETMPHENPAELNVWRARVLADGLKSVETQHISRILLSNSADPLQVLLPEWRVPLVKTAPMTIQNGLIEFTLTDQFDVTTKHLFVVDL
jgi:general secretion pathway protein J